MSKRRVVVTGIGAVTPIGNSVEEFWEGIRKEKQALDRLPDLMQKNIKSVLWQK